MNGYKTGGDWTDVTSIGRNEVVFEGRHKAYGAYFIRKRYTKALYFSFLSALTFIALCAYIPYMLRNISPVKITPANVVNIKPQDVLVHREIIVPPVTHPPFRPRINPSQHLVPLIVQHTIIDSAPRPIIESIQSLPGNSVPGNAPVTEVTVSGPAGEPSPLPPLEKVFTWVTEMPKFPGGDVETYIGNKITYSAEDAQLGIEGTVYASFIIEKDGSVSNVKLLRGISGGTDINNNALKVLSEMPKWIPGKQDGHPVRIQFSIPIQFKLH